jgi:MFS family permease
MDPQPEILKNLKHNLIVNLADGAFFGFAIGASSFITILPLFVSTLTTSALLIGLIPAIHNAGWQFPQLFTARWVARQRYVKPLVLSLTLIERLPFLCLAFVAWFAARLGVGTTLTLTFVLLTIQGLGAGLTANPWQSMMGKIMPDDRRGGFFGLQAGASNLLASLGAIIAGALLANLISPYDYTSCFLLTSGLMVVSYIFLAWTREPLSPVSDTPGLLETHGLWASMGDILRRDRNFRWFLAARMASQMVLMGFAFYTVYAVQQQGVSKMGAGWMTGTLLAVSIVANIAMGALGDRWGHRYMMEFGLLAGIISAVLAWWAPTPGWFYLVYALEAIALVAVWTTGMAMTLQFGSEAERPAYIGMANTFVAPANILAPFFGGWLADQAGYPAAFLAAAAGGLVAAFIFHFLVRDPHRPAPYKP